MQQYKMKLASTVAAMTLMLTMSTPVIASDLEISGNGSGSNNTINVTNVCNVSVNQTSKTYAYVSVNASSNTGNNTANDNTGGDVTVDTGNATTSVNTTVSGGSNEATAPSCCGCEQSAPSALISGNGNNSDSVVNDTNVHNTTLTQRTRTRARVKVKKAKAKTGNNSATGNTGSGLVEVLTGNANTTVDTTVEGGSNTLNP